MRRAHGHHTATTETDRYGRTVVSVRCDGTPTWGAAQVRAGLAWVYTPYAKQHPQLVPLQREAQASKVGLWSSAPAGAMDYRRHHQRR